MAENQKNLNPQITQIDIGKRNLRSITLYPMSLADEELFGDVIQKALQKYFEQEVGGEEGLIEFVDFMLKLIKDNIIKILGFITEKEEKPKKIFNEMTNLQLSELANKIYRINFEEPSKNAKGLLETIKSMFLSRRLLQPSLNDTDNTTLVTSTPEVSETEDLQKNNF